MKLRDYQQRGIELLRAEISKGKKRIVLAMPTGSGKSALTAQIIQTSLEKGNTVLWLVHRRNLVQQFRQTLERFGVTPGTIMAGVASETTLPCQICTIQSYSRRIKLEKLSFNRFFINADLIIVDEVQRALSKTYQDVLSLYQDKIVIGTTATPAGPQGRGLGEYFEVIVDVIGVRELTKLGYLSPVRYFAATTPALAGVKVAMGDYVVKQLEKKVNTTKLNGDVVEAWLKHGGDKRTLVFCVSVKHSVAICAEFNKNGIPAEHLDAKSSDEERNDVFYRMENGDVKVVCNVFIYTEGLDVPAVENIVIARPTRSLGLYRQIAGRGMRVAPEKRELKVFDHSGVIEEHGFLEDEIEWSLDGKERAWKKAKPKRVIKPAMKCRVCHQIFKGLKVCPVCGTELKSFGKKIETTDAELVELKAKKKNNRISTWAEKRQFMGMLQYLENEKKWNSGRKAHLYKLFFGCWPNDQRVRDVAPIKPIGKLGNMVKHVLIKSAMIYKKGRK